MTEYSAEKIEALERVYRVINLRSIAIGIAVLLGVVGAIVARALTPLLCGLFLASIGLFYNLTGYLYLRKKESLLSHTQIINLCSILLIADAITITVLVHLTGGVLSPFVSMYLYPIVIISLVSPERPFLIHGLALIIIVLFEFLLFFEFYQVFPRFTVIQQGLEVYQDVNLNLYYQIVFPTFVITLIFFSTTLSNYLIKGKKALEERVKELNQLRQHLEETLKETERKTAEITILYEFATRSAFPLEKFASRLAKTLNVATVEIFLFENGEPKMAASFGLPIPESPTNIVLENPLIHQEKKLGILKLTRLNQQEFSLDEKRVLSIIADRLAREIAHQKMEAEREKLNEELKAKVKELEVFHDLAVGRELRMMELEKEIETLKRQSR